MITLMQVQEALIKFADTCKAEGNPVDLTDANVIKLRKDIREEWGFNNQRTVEAVMLDLFDSVGYAEYGIKAEDTE